MTATADVLRTLLGTPTMFTRLLVDDRGQDIIEYALLTAAIGIAGAVTWPLITDAIGAAYAAFDADTQAIWEVPDPGQGGM